jgi:hypothetical protein
MPQIVAAAMAQSAMAAPVAAATAATAATAAGSTAAIEAAKQAAIQAAMKQQAAQLAAQQATQSAVTQQAAQTGIQQAGAAAASQAAQQASVEAAKQGIFSGGGAGMPPPPSGAPLPPAAPPAPAGSTPNLEALKAQTIQSGSPSVTPSLDTLKARAIQSGSPIAPESQLLAEQAARMPSTGGNFPGIKMKPDQAFGPDSSGIYKGMDPETGQAFETFSSPTFSPPADTTGLKVSDAMQQSFGTPPPKNPLEKGFDMALKYVNKGLDYAEKNPLTTGMGLMTAGQYLNQPKPPEKKQYKSMVDMSKFKLNAPALPAFQRSYEYQTYAAGGPVEQMSAQNAIGSNSMYPQALYETPIYTNPAVQRPMPNDVISQGIDTPVDPYTGEQRMASGGISAADARKYGLKDRKQRALENLQTLSSQAEKEREQTMAEVKRRGDTFDEGIIPRSRKQQLSSPLTAAKEEFAMLAKKNKVPLAELPKTNLGDIESYMDTPIEAAQGGIMGNLGSYSDGGRLLRGPGDGVSDSIPAVIGKRQPARLADGEFVIPARIVSELGNGSTEAGARKLYAMMERIQRTRKKSIGKKKVAVNSRADKHLPA